MRPYKHTLKHLQEFVLEKHNGKCLATNYTTVGEKYEWECEKGHRWLATANAILCNHWCPTCRHHMHSLEDAQKIAKERAGECLSLNYKNVNATMLWKCKLGHVWEATFSSIDHGSWCAICSSGLYERICRTFFDQLFNEKFVKERPDWLINSNSFKMELDGYCSKFNLAFEHNGTQHYSKISKYCVDLEKRKRDDEMKLKLCKEHGITLIVVPELETMTKIENLKEFIKEQLIINNFPISEINFDKNIDFSQAYIPEDATKNEEIKKLAADKNIQMLSGCFIGMHTRHEWKCNVCNYIWKTTPNSLFGKHATNCPKCSKKAPGTTAEFEALIEGKGGKLLSEYVNCKTKIKIQCNECGYIWDVAPVSIKCAGRWCPNCAGQGKPTIEYIESLSGNKGKCLNANEYKSAHGYLFWECNCGNVFKASYNNVRKGRWCPKCRGRDEPINKVLENLASNHNGKCLDINEFVHGEAPIRWQCEKGHIFEMPYNRVNAGCWCQKCAGVARPTVAFLQSLAKKHRGECLDAESYQNSYTKMSWRCECGHIFKARYQDIRDGAWCPKRRVPGHPYVEKKKGWKERNSEFLNQ